jgi:hypothetical protein
MLNAYRLQEFGKGKEFGRNVAEVYKIDTLSRYIKIESVILLTCILVVSMSVVVVFLGSAVFMIVTVISAWFASIAYRFYKTHRRCFWHLIEIAAQPCPYCGKVADQRTMAEHLVLTNPQKQ